jgi:hypothetical protein
MRVTRDSERELYDWTGRQFEGRQTRPVHAPAKQPGGCGGLRRSGLRRAWCEESVQTGDGLTGDGWLLDAKGKLQHVETRPSPVQLRLL